MKTFLAFVFLFLGLSAQAQRMKPMEWADYNLGFSVPNSFSITENTDDRFTASGEDITLHISPYKDETLTSEDVANRALQSLNASGVELTLNEPVELQGFEGYQMVGYGQQDGRDLLFLVLGLIDPDGDTNLAAYVMWWHDEARNDMNTKTALKILKSFKKLNP